MKDSPGELKISGPLSEAWWLQHGLETMPDPHTPLLAPYNKTRPGFETGISASSLGMSSYFREIGGGYYEFSLWNIWKKEDLAQTDPEKQAINRMQLALGELTDDDRYIRIQIACLARCFWTFPATLDLILEGITTGTVILNEGISCEPPWTGLRKILLLRRQPDYAKEHPHVRQMHHTQGLDPCNEPRQKRLRAYMKVLTWWMAQGHLDCLKTEMAEDAGLAETIYRWLGRPDREKLILVQKLVWHLSVWAIPNLPGDRFDQDMAGIRSSFDQTFEKELGERGEAITRLIARNHDFGSCHHAFIRHIDHIIAQIGAGRPVTLPGAGQERVKVLGAVAGYTFAIGSWLARRTVDEAVKIDPHSRETVARVWQILGQPTPRKRWLAACLWKKLQEDRIHAGRGALSEDPARFALPIHVFTAT